MTDETPPEKSPPPKIKLGNGNGNGNGNGKTKPILSESGLPEKPTEGAPPKIQVPKTLPQQSSPPPPPTGVARPKDQTVYLGNMAPDEQDDSTSSETTKIDLHSAKPAGVDDNLDLSQTIQVDLTEAKPEDSNDQATEDDDLDLSQTIRVDVTQSESAGENGETGKIDTPKANPVGIDSSDDLGKTTRVDLSAEEGDSASETTRIDVNEARPVGSDHDPFEGNPATLEHPDAAKSEGDSNPLPKSDSVDINPSAEQQAPVDTENASKMQTMRIEIPQGIPSTQKADTTRVKLSETQTNKSATKELKAVRAAEQTKSKTGTIPLGDKGELDKIVDAQSNVTKQTMRIEIDQTPTAQTGKVNALNTAHIPQRTSEIDLSEMMSVPASSSKSPRKKTGTPKTIRIKKTDTPPPTRVLKKPAGRSQTIQVTDGDLSDSPSAKSGTTRIDPSEETSSSGEKKTIRIRRPETVAGQPLVVSRPSNTGFASSPKKSISPSIQGFSWIYSAAAVLAVLLTGLAIYIMAAQISSIPSDGISWPWLGRVL